MTLTSDIIFYYHTSIFGRTLPRTQLGFFILLFTRLPAVSALIFAGSLRWLVTVWTGPRQSVWLVV